MAFEGGCLCESVRFRVDRKFLNAMHCYCEMCRKSHGTAMSTHVIVRPDQLHFLAGRDTLVPFESSPGGFRRFCPQCGTHVLVHGQSGDETFAVPAGLFDGKPEMTIRGHMFVGELVPWFQISDELPQHTEWPPGFG